MDRRVLTPADLIPLSRWYDCSVRELFHLAPRKLWGIDLPNMAKREYERMEVTGKLPPYMEHFYLQEIRDHEGH